MRVIKLFMRDYGQHGLLSLGFLLISFLFCFPLMSGIDLLGRGDWDYFFALYEVAYKTIREYHQIPLWNPYSSGGMSFIGNPQQGGFSPIMAVVLLWGPVVGLKLAVWGHIFAALWGCWSLAGHFGLKGSARFVPAAIVVFSSHWPLHLTEGHIIWLSAAFMPWFFLFLLKGIRGAWRFLIGTAVFEAIIFYEGGTYVLVAAILLAMVYSFFISLRERRWHPLMCFLAVQFMAVVLMAPKLLPVVELLFRHQHIVGPGMPISPQLSLSFFVDRLQTLQRGFLFGAGYWEYGAYVGILPGILYFGSFFLLRRHPALVLTSVVMALFCLGNFAAWAPWTVLHQLPIIKTFHIPMRLVLGFLLPFGLLAGIFLKEIEKRSRILAFIVMILLAADIFFIGSRVFTEAARPLTIRDRVLVQDNGHFTQEMVTRKGHSAFGAWSDQFVFVRHNKGVVDAYEPVRVARRAVARTDPRYRGEVYWHKGQGLLDKVSWSPNKLSYQIDSSEGGVLVINQNFDPGWRVSAGEIFSHDGLIAVRVPAGEHALLLRYLPFSFLLGVGILGVGILGSGWVFLRERT